MKPGGTGSPRVDICARFAPFPPKRLTIDLSPSLNEYTRLLRIVSFDSVVSTTEIHVPADNSSVSLTVPEVKDCTSPLLMEDKLGVLNLINPVTQESEANNNSA